MHIEGEDLPDGNYLFHRYVTWEGEKKLVNTYKIKKTAKGYEFYDSEKGIEKEIRRIELKKGNIALVWSCGSRLGLLYSIVLEPKE